MAAGVTELGEVFSDGISSASRGRDKPFLCMPDEDRDRLQEDAGRELAEPLMLRDESLPVLHKLGAIPPVSTMLNSGGTRVRWSARMNAIKPQSTHKNTMCAVNTLTSWLRKHNEYRQINNIPADELDAYLVSFFSTIKRKNGSEYHPSSLMSLRKFLDFHLKENGYPYSITTSVNFAHSQQVFRSKHRELNMLLAHKKALDASLP